VVKPVDEIPQLQVKKTTSRCINTQSSMCEFARGERVYGRRRRRVGLEEGL
jgi:hypothetical protein